MTSLSASSPRSAGRHFREWFVAALFFSLAATLAVALSSDLTSLVALLAVVPVALAAYSRRGMVAVVLIILFIDSALLPAALQTWGTPAFSTTLIGLVTYSLILVLFGFLAANLAHSMRNRRTLTGTVFEQDSLLERASSSDEVVAFLRAQAQAQTGAGRAAMIVRNPVDGLWSVANDQGEVRLQGADRASLAQWLIDRNETVIVDDLYSDPRFAPHTGRGIGVPLTLLARPLKDENGDTLAILALFDLALNPFSDTECEALDPLITAGQRALAQAGRYALADSALTRRLHQLNALQRAAQDLNEILDPWEIAQRALHSAIDITAADAGLLGVERSGWPPIHSLWNAGIDEEVIHALVEMAPSLPPVLLVAANDDSVPGLLSEAAPRLVTPIRRDEQTFGVLILASSQPGAFGPEMQRTVTSLADYAAVAFENTQLFQQLQSEKQRSEQMVTNLTDGLLTITSAGVVTSLNPAAEELTGWRDEEALGHEICQVFGCRETRQCNDRCVFHGLVEHTSAVFEDRWTIRPRWGGERTVEVRAAPLAGRGDPGDGKVVLIHDISDKWRMEQFQRDLIATFSHELRTPLANISAITQMLIAGQTSGSAEGSGDDLETLQAQSLRLEELANRFMDLSRIETGDLRLELRPVPAGALVREVVDQWRSTQHHNQLHLHTVDPSAWVWADEQALRTVVDSLIDNAVKYAPADTAVDIVVARDGPDRAAITVRDAGPGIATEDQQRIFERFQRLDSSDARQTYGYGLGLYVARMLAEGMNGSISVSSEPGQGSEFMLTLPVWREDHGEDIGD